MQGIGLRSVHLYVSRPITPQIRCPVIAYVIPGWEATVSDYFNELGQTMEYQYDFGDGWEHELLFVRRKG